MEDEKRERERERRAVRDVHTIMRAPITSLSHSNSREKREETQTHKEGRISSVPVEKEIENEK